MTGNLFIVAAASGTGKTSLLSALLQNDSHIRLSISYTTRKPRPGEMDGVHYHFVDEAEFLRMLGEGDFLESAEVHGARYGTSQSRVEEALKAGDDLILEIDWQGAQQVRKQLPDAVGIFILPPSIDTLAHRLAYRGQDSMEVITRRLAAAREEISHVAEFDYVIINDNFQTALEDLRAVIRSQHLKRDQQLLKHQGLLNSMK
ncbi:MAG: guanylate kinase [Betaproteobacteria bacterium HGW-Betaproteobacteria-1]|jgi:guanylate kinase|nr:MAG: guanylate kinase [Betaproteobacteria bacterium HGW-Betaproteobacteria-1]